MTKEELASALKEAIGGTADGEAIIADLVDNFGSKYSAKDRLDIIIGVTKGWEKKHEAAGETAKAEAEAAKVAVAEKALAVVEKLS